MVGKVSCVTSKIIYICMPLLTKCGECKVTACRIIFLQMQNPHLLDVESLAGGKMLNSINADHHVLVVLSQ